MLWNVNHVLAFEDRLQKLSADAYEAAQRYAWYDRVMSDRPGTGRKEHFEWLLTTASIEKLPHGTMRYDDLVTQAHYVEHEDYGKALKVRRNQWKDDEAHFAADWIKQINGAMALEPQYQAIALMLGGETNKAYDGVSFFNAAHPVNPFDVPKGTYRNLVTDMVQIGGSAGAPALTKANVALGAAHMKSFKMPNGRNRAQRPDLLICGPKKELDAREALFAGFANATQNVLKDYQIDLLVVHEIEDESWILQATVGETPDQKPYVRSVREVFEMTSYDGLTQAELNRMRELEWQIIGRYGYTYGHPYQQVKFKPS